MESQGVQSKRLRLLNEIRRAWEALEHSEQDAEYGQGI